MVTGVVDGEERPDGLALGVEQAVLQEAAHDGLARTAEPGQHAGVHGRHPAGCVELPHQVVGQLAEGAVALGRRGRRPVRRVPAGRRVPGIGDGERGGRNHAMDLGFSRRCL